MNENSINQKMFNSEKNLCNEKIFDIKENLVKKKLFISQENFLMNRNMNENVLDKNFYLNTEKNISESSSSKSNSKLKTNLKNDSLINPLSKNLNSYRNSIIRNFISSNNDLTNNNSTNNSTITKDSSNNPKLANLNFPNDNSINKLSNFNKNSNSNETSIDKSDIKNKISKSKTFSDFTYEDIDDNFYSNNCENFYKYCKIVNEKKFICRPMPRKEVIKPKKLKPNTRKNKWKQCFDFFNPFFLISVFFYLLYCELTAVRGEILNSNITFLNKEFFLINNSSNEKIYSLDDFYKQINNSKLEKKNFFGKTRNDNFKIDNLPIFKVLAILPTIHTPEISKHFYRAIELNNALKENLVSNLELAHYFDHLKYPYRSQTELSSSLHHLQNNQNFYLNKTFENFAKFNENYLQNKKLFLNLNHSELSYEDHLYIHLLQRIYRRNHTNIETNNFFYPNSKNYENNQSPDNKINFLSKIQTSLLPLGNSSQRLINSFCDTAEIQRPSLILSLVEPTRSYYLEMLARITEIPLLTLSGEYMETASLQNILLEGKISETSMQLSLDPPISALADATFQLLKTQHWFDAILLIDDTSASDLFSYRLSQLCRQNDHRSKMFYQNKFSRYDEQTKHSTFSFMKDKFENEDGIRNYNRKEFNEDNYEFIDSIWTRLKIIRVSKNLLQKELYLQLSEIQTNHRRVVLVHCDKVTTKRVITTSKTLGLLDGSKIWVLLDGVIGSHIDTAEFLYEMNLPVGMLALHQRAPSLQDAQTLFNIVRIIGETAANTLLNAKDWMYEGSFSNGSQPEVSCWQKATSARIKYSQVVYQELKKIMKQFLYINHNKSKCKTTAKENFSTDKLNEKTVNLSSLKQISNEDLNKNFSVNQFPKTINRIKRHKTLKKRNNYYFDNDKNNEDPLVEKLKEMWPTPVFDVLNLVPNINSKVKANQTYKLTSSFLNNLLPKIALKSGLIQTKNYWKVIGNISDSNSTINSIKFITGKSGDRVIGPGSSSKHNFRIVSAISPPFVQHSTKLINGTCLTGIPCLKVNSSEPEDLVSVFTDFNSKIRRFEGKTYTVLCCEGISIDLLNSIARDLHFSYEMYLVADGLFGLPRKINRWDGITGDLISGSAHMAFSAFSITSARVQVIDFSVPFFYSGVSCLAQQRTSDVPLTAFLIPFSIQLWVAIFSSLLLTAIASATYEFMSPYGLNPHRGRQRTKNFSIGSAFWVMFSILFSHLYAFKAPKSWPNKVLLNLWGCFSVIFLATYTANVAAQFAGLFNTHEINNFNDGILMEKKVGVARSSASEGYIMKENMQLWSHVQKNRVNNLEEGIQLLRENKIEVLIGDTAILDYFRANEPGCNFNLLGDSIFDDAYAIGMQRNFPLKDAISDLIMEYNAYGFLDQLQRRWYGRAPCLENSLSNLRKPKPLSVRALAGVFIMLFIGMCIGVLILIGEHFLFKYGIPRLRKKSKDCFWKSPNLMFFSQKLYRFINSVELVSPHHSAKEIMSSLKTGQITTLFQKSLKRKAKEDARRRKSKYQFFEMIQEVRNVVKERKKNDPCIVGDSSINYPLKQDSFFSETDSIGNQTTIRTSSIKWKEETSNNSNSNLRNEYSAAKIREHQQFKSSLNNKARQGSVHTQQSAKELRSTIILHNEKKINSIDKTKNKNVSENLIDKQKENLNKNISKVKHSHNILKCLNNLDIPENFYKSQSSNLSSEFLSDKNCLLRVASGGQINQPHLHYENKSNYNCNLNEKVQHINLHSNISISLEDITLPGDSGSGIGFIKREDSSLVNKNFKKTLSFDDLTTLKKQLNYCVNSNDTENNSLNISNCNLMMMEDNSARNSMRSLILSSISPLRNYNYSKFDTVQNSNLSKEDIVSLWKNSERELLNNLHNILMQKKNLEEKCNLLQRMLTKNSY